MEDNEVNREVTLSMLEYCGLQADSVTYGHEALASQPWNYDLILMDVQMPGMDGLEATRLIRQHEQHLGQDPVTIVAITANGRKHDLKACLSAGMNACITKPFMIEDIMALVQRYLDPNLVGANNHKTTANPLRKSCVLTDITNALDKKVLAKIKHNMQHVPGRYVTILNMFLQSTVLRLSEIQAGIAAGNTEQVYRNAHSAKSQSAMVGAIALSDIFKELELLGCNGELVATPVHLRKAQEEFQTISHALQEEISREQAQSAKNC